MLPRSLIGERGYAYIELLVAIILTGVISLSIMQMIGISMQTFTSASSLEFAQMGTRAGLNSMANDLRLMGSYYTGAGGAAAAITTATATSLTFLGDINANTVDGTGHENTLAAQAAAGSKQLTVTSANDPSGNPAFGVNGYVYIGNGATREVAQITGLNGTAISLATALLSTYPAGSLVRSVENVTYKRDAPTSTLVRCINRSPCTAPFAASETLADNLSGLTFTYYDGSNPPAVTAVLAQIRQIDVSLTVTQPDARARTMVTRMRPLSLGP